MGDRPPSVDESALEDSAVEEVLTRGTLELTGRLVAASNASFVGTVELDGLVLSCIYKPVAGERPLWDFPDGTLAGRERAARVVSEAAGWRVVPATVLRDGRFGGGMVQHWVEVVAERTLVDVVAPQDVQPGWLSVLEAEDGDGQAVRLVHADDARLRTMSVFDVVVNNADRKGGHVLYAGSGAVWGCDHGVCFHTEPKLRTVLWGWAEQPLRDEDRDSVARLVQALDDGLDETLAELLSRPERDALRRRAAGLVAAGRMPSPTGRWPVIPWPPF